MIHHTSANGTPQEYTTRLQIVHHKTANGTPQDCKWYTTKLHRIHHKIAKGRPHDWKWFTKRLHIVHHMNTNGTAQDCKEYTTIPRLQRVHHKTPAKSTPDDCNGYIIRPQRVHHKTTKSTPQDCKEYTTRPLRKIHHKLTRSWYATTRPPQTIERRQLPQILFSKGVEAAPSCLKDLPNYFFLLAPPPPPPPVAFALQLSLTLCRLFFALLKKRDAGSWLTTTISNHVICSLMTESSGCELSEAELEACVVCAFWLATGVCHSQFADTLMQPIICVSITPRAPHLRDYRTPETAIRVCNLRCRLVWDIGPGFD